MSTFFTAEYWPLFRTTELRRFDYTDETGQLAPITSVFSYDAPTDSMLYTDFNEAGVWQDTWYYQYRKGFGIAEWRDDYPWLSWMKKKVVMDPPIGWGEYLQIGHAYINFPKMIPWKCMPPQFSNGQQFVIIDEHLDDFVLHNGRVYHDVILMRYKQTWSGGQPHGAKYWMAKGIGPVAIQWMGWDPKTGAEIITARIDAAITSVNRPA